MYSLALRSGYGDSAVCVEKSFEGGDACQLRISGGGRPLIHLPEPRVESRAPKSIADGLAARWRRPRPRGKVQCPHGSLQRMLLEPLGWKLRG